MAGAPQNDEDGVISGINVTPLVDVVLVLLIIFIVTASFILRTAIPMELPRAATSEEAASGLLTVAIAREEGGEGGYRLYFNGRPGEIADLPQVVADARQRLPEGQRELRVFVSADVNAAYGEFARVVDALRQEGVVDIALDTKPIEIEEPAR